MAPASVGAQGPGCSPASPGPCGRSRAGDRLVSAARELLSHCSCDLARLEDLATVKQFLEEVVATCGLDTGRSPLPQLARWVAW